MKFLTFILLLVLSISAKAQQNLVPNPSFEDTLGCPQDVSGQYGDEIYNLTYWFPASNSPDYFNVCSNSQASVPMNGMGFQTTFNGNGYIGLFTIGNFGPFTSNYREYIGVPLSQSLVIGTKYFFKMHVSSGYGGIQWIYYYSNNLGIKLSQNRFEAQINPLAPDNNPTANFDTILSDTTNWKELQFSFTADSAYSYLYIGNFFDDTNTDSIQVPGTSFGEGAYYYIDGVCLSTDSLYCETWTGLNYIHQEEVSLWPNPTSDYFEFKAMQVIDEINVYDFSGRLVRSEKINSGRGRINLSGFPAGVYLATFRKEGYISSYKFSKY